MTVRWTKEALNDLEEIESYIARDSLERAYTFIEELLNFGDTLGNFPEKGTQAKWTKNRYFPTAPLASVLIYIFCHKNKETAVDT